MPGVIKPPTTTGRRKPRTVAPKPWTSQNIAPTGSTRNKRLPGAASAPKKERTGTGAKVRLERIKNRKRKAKR